MLVEFDDENSYPSDLLDLLASAYEDLKEFNRIRRLRDRQRERRNTLMFIEPQNPLKERNDEVRRRAAELASRHSIVGYHCTRLTEDEVGAITDAGLFILDQTLVEAKIARRLSAGDLTEGQAREVISRNAATTIGRKGLLWLTVSIDTLRDASAVGRFFRTWGGEAIYWNRENDLAWANLRTFGQPAIVKAQLASEDIEGGLGSLLVDGYLKRRRVKAGGCRTDVCMKRGLTAYEILQVITASDIEFRHLTRRA